MNREEEIKRWQASIDDDLLEELQAFLRIFESCYEELVP